MKSGAKIGRSLEPVTSSNTGLLGVLFLFVLNIINLADNYGQQTPHKYGQQNPHKTRHR